MRLYLDVAWGVFHSLFFWPWRARAVLEGGGIWLKSENFRHLRIELCVAINSNTERAIFATAHHDKNSILAGLEMLIVGGAASAIAYGLGSYVETLIR